MPPPSPATTSSPALSPAITPALSAADFARLRLHIVTGKGGAGKTTVAGALALALAAGGRRVLLVEVEGRQGIAQTLDVAPLADTEARVANAPGGGEVYGLAIDAKAALLEYLQLFYHMGRLGGILERFGAIDFATTIAPGLRDVLQIGKVYEASRRTTSGKNRGGDLLYDAIVLDAPPTGRITRFLTANTEIADLARVGPIKGQAESITAMMHAPTTAVHIVTLLEEMPVQETLDAVAELHGEGIAVGWIVVNQLHEPLLSPDALAAARDDALDAESAAAGLRQAGLKPDEPMVDGLLAEAHDHALRVDLQAAQEALIAATGLPLLRLPAVTEGIDAAVVRTLSGLLTEQGVG